ncbi:MAG: 1,4-dihydroxy-2-naphthoate polyprenyltransferase [Gemmatimonadota bacterium]|nr:1,4-dihydroxy-2-naphthoate polyprenyltransferase [Gemmatimonadota bacterium]
MSPSRGRALLLAARPTTLTAALVPVGVGTALAAFEGHPVRWTLAALALGGAAAIQIGTNLYNDLLDFERGADVAGRAGPLRVTQAGLLSPRQVRWAAGTSFLLAVAAGLPLVLAGGWPILALGLLSLLFGYAYTGGPYPLAYHGLGELFVLLFFGLGAVGGTYWLHAGRLDPTVALAGVQVGLLACALLAVNNLRDIVEDARADKRTLAVMLGRTFGRAEIALCALTPPLLGLVWLRHDAVLAALLPLLSLPLGLGTVRIVVREPPGPSYNRALARAAGLQLVFGALLVAGLVV